MLKKSIPLLIIIFSVIMLISCAKKKEDKHLPYDKFRVSKSIFNSTPYYFSETITKTDMKSNRLIGSDSNRFKSRIVYLKLTENHLNIIQSSVEGEKYLDKDESKNSMTETIISRFRVRHIDITRAKDGNEEETNVFQEDTERPWYARTHVVIDFEDEEVLDRNVYIEGHGAYAHPLKKAKSIGDVQNVEISKDYISIETKKKMVGRKSSDVFTMKYALLPVEKTNYKEKLYPEELQNKVGYFKTKIKKFDDRGNIEYDYLINRFDPKKRITLYLSESWNYNDAREYKPIVYESVAKWNKVFKKATGIDNYIILKESNGSQTLGDLRYNMIHWVGERTISGILGFAPATINPRTGEIINANVVIYGDNLKASLERSLEYEEKIAENKKRYYDRIEKEVPKSDKKIKHAPIKEQLAHLAETVNDRFYDFTTPKREDADEDVLEERKLTNMAVLKAKSLDKSLYKLNEKLTDVLKITDITKKINLSQLSELDEYRRMPSIQKVLDSGKSMDELIEEYFLFTFLHELGHTFNLRHNFKASFDKKNFSKDEKTGKEMRLSSVMDYTDDYEYLLNTPGSYDERAIILAYSNEDLSKVEDIPFLYCTDNHVFADPLCSPYDIGTTAVEIVDNLVKEYEEYYWLRNHKISGHKKFNNGKRVIDTFISTLFYTAVPIRLFLDYRNYRQKQVISSGADFAKYMESDEYKDLTEAAYNSMKFLFSMLYTDKPDEDIITRDNEIIQYGITVDRIAAMLVLNLPTIGVLGLDRYEIISTYPGLLLDLKASPDIFTKLMARGASEDVMIFDYYTGIQEESISLPKGLGKIIAISLLTHKDGSVRMGALDAGRMNIIKASKKDPYWKMKLLKDERLEILKDLTMNFEYVVLNGNFLKPEELENKIQEAYGDDPDLSNLNLLKKTKKYEELLNRTGFKDEYELAKEATAADKIRAHVASELLTQAFANGKFAASLIDSPETYKELLDYRLVELKAVEECWGCPDNNNEKERLEKSLELLIDYIDIQNKVNEHQEVLNKHYNETKQTVILDEKNKFVIIMENEAYLAKELFYPTCSERYRITTNETVLGRKKHELSVLKRLYNETQKIGDQDEIKSEIKIAQEKIENVIQILEFNRRFFDYQIERSLSDIYEYNTFYNTLDPTNKHTDL